MGRLTFFDDFNEPCYRLGNGVHKNDISRRLAAYENTGLEPEEVDQICRAAEHMMFETVGDFARYAIANFEELEAYRALAPIDHLRELVQSEKNGQLVVLPCKEFYEKIGDFLYLIDGGEIIEVLHEGVFIDADGIVTAIVNAGDKIFPFRESDPEHDTDPTDCCVSIKGITLDDFGKTVFLTREEAEAALEALKGGDGNG